LPQQFPPVVYVSGRRSGEPRRPNSRLAVQGVYLQAGIIRNRGQSCANEPGFRLQARVAFQGIRILHYFGHRLKHIGSPYFYWHLVEQPFDLLDLASIRRPNDENMANVLAFHAHKGDFCCLV
jgi:hypothetical protein